MILAFIVVSVCQAQGLVNRSLGGMLVPICCYVCMSISLNLTVGILGELSLGHAGFMAIGAYVGALCTLLPEQKEIMWILDPIIWPFSVCIRPSGWRSSPAVWWP